MKNARIVAIEYHLPGEILDTARLSAEHPGWNADKLDQASGIRQRRIAAAGECASDLAVAAAEKLFATGLLHREEVDFLLFCTQSPDFLVPTTACLIQHRLGLPSSCGAVDYSLGHSGYVYGLGLAAGLIASGQANTLLLLTGETYSRYIHPEDKSSRVIFGDAGTATLIRATDEAGTMGPFVNGTEGSGAENIMVPAGGARLPRTQATALAQTDENGNTRSENDLRMNGAEVFSFTLAAVPASVQQLLERAGCEMSEIDAFIFHQSNRYILEHLRKKCGIPREKFLVALEECGNTVSNSIPLALKLCRERGQLMPDQLLALVGYGAGFSWGAALVRW